MLQYETEQKKRGISLIAGIDEAGRGPLAGPVVAASVILPSNFFSSDIVDSKKLSPKKREKLFSLIYLNAISVGVGIVDNHDIDRDNILVCTKLAMVKAVKHLLPQPEVLLIDGRDTINCDILQNAIIKGDTKSQSIAAASIIAKVTRDRIMSCFHRHYPLYHFDSHKGYGTKKHMGLIKKYGPCTIHRKTFIHL